MCVPVIFFFQRTTFGCIENIQEYREYYFLYIRLFSLFHEVEKTLSNSPLKGGGTQYRCG